MIRATIVVRPGSSEAERRKIVQDLASRLPGQRRHVSAKSFVRTHGARKEDIALIRRFARSHHLKIGTVSRSRRCVVVSGTLAAFSRAFAVNFTCHDFQGRSYRSFGQQIRVPKYLKGVVEGVLGLEDRPLMCHHAFFHAAVADRHTDPSEVARAYDFPKRATGAGQRIAIVELGGGFHRKDISDYFKKRGLPAPSIAVVEIKGQKNDPAPAASVKTVLDLMGATPSRYRIEPGEGGDGDREEKIRALWTIEATLDIQLAGSFADGADLVVYFAPNNAQGKYHALTTALHSTRHPPTVIACSWGAVEEELPAHFVRSMNQVFQDAALKGVTVCFSSGDRGDDPGANGQPRVHYPASSPYVLSCGGTHWTPEAPEPQEVVWNEQLSTTLAQSGGGVSRSMDEPPWQAPANIHEKTGARGRGVPDVAGKADMKTGYCMLVGGYDVAMGGTSSVVPLWAGLIARLNQALKTNVGYITPLLYNTEFRNAFRDVTEGNNGKHYQACPGWDACTGMGTPRGNALLAALAGSQEPDGGES